MNVGTLARTLDLMQESVAILLADKEILVFPLLSALMLVVVDGPILLPLRSHLREPPTLQEVYRMLFLLYSGSYFVIIFFNSALMACANIRLSGGDPTLSDGFRFAWENVERILLWSLIAATVGILLRMLEQSRVLRWVVGRALELGWSLATFFIIPVIIFEDLDVLGSFKRSADLFRRRWGEEVTSNFSFSVLFGLLAIPGVMLICVSRSSSVVGVVAAGLYLALLYIVSTALQGIFVVALYRCTTDGSEGFNPRLIQGAFSTRPDLDSGR
jgi:hypothetical protein